MIRIILVAFAHLLLLASVTHSRDITLEWDPNTEPDIAGYKIYYKAASPELPLDGTGAEEGPSPVDVKENTRAVLKGLDDSKIYYFAVTAYNSAGYESSFSNIVASDWIPVQTTPQSDSTVPGSAVQFTWTSPPPGLDVTYTLYYGTDPSLSAAAIVSPGGPPSSISPLSSPPVWLPGVVALLLTLSLAPRSCRARSAVSCVLCVLFLASCGGGGGGGGTSERTVGSSDNGGNSGGENGDGSAGPFTRVVDVKGGTSFTATGLAGGTYYWKVVADDGEKRRESTIFAFIIQ